MATTRSTSKKTTKAAVSRTAATTSTAKKTVMKAKTAKTVVKNAMGQSATIDFKEIPEAGKGPGRDSWEMFAAEFLRALGFEILEPPARGPDGGKDMLVVEHLAGRFAVRKIHWLVSCKHQAHSTRSVSITDENDFSDRLEASGADGFLGFYFTMPAASIVNRLSKICPANNKIYQILGPENITTHLTSEPAMRIQLFRRFFPKSYERWMQAGDAPALLWSKYVPLPCEACGADLLEAVPNEDPPDSSFRHRHVKSRGGEIVLPSQGQRGVYAAHWGDCAKKMERRTHNSSNYSLSLTELCEPQSYLRAWCKLLLSRNRLENNDARKLARYMLSVAQFVMRDTQTLMPGFEPYARTIGTLLSQTFGNGDEEEDDDGGNSGNDGNGNDDDGDDDGNDNGNDDGGNDDSGGGKVGDPTSDDGLDFNGAPRRRPHLGDDRNLDPRSWRPLREQPSPQVRTYPTIVEDSVFAAAAPQFDLGLSRDPTGK